MFNLARSEHCAASKDFVGAVMFAPRGLHYDLTYPSSPLCSSRLLWQPVPGSRLRFLYQVISDLATGC